MVQRRILVTGATGYVGGRLVPRLLERGCTVRCLARNPYILHGRGWEGAEIVQGDALEPQSLVHVLKDIDTAYYLIHSLLHGKRWFEGYDRVAAANFAHAAKKSGVKRIIYLGGMGAEEDELSPHLYSRHEVGRILRLSGIPITEFRAAIIVGSGSISFEIIRYITERVPVMICPKWINTRCQPIAINDVLSYLIAALDEPKCVGKTFEIGGGDVLTYKNMLLEYARLRGLKRYVISLPLLKRSYAAFWAGVITPVPSSIVRTLIEGLKNDVICTNNLALRTFSIKPMIYQEAVELALKRISEGKVETIWSNSPSLLRPGMDYAHALETREGMIIETNQEEVDAPPSEVFNTFSGLGGQRGWLFANWAWRLRAVLDRIFGGLGMRRGRRDPDRVIPGDVVDFWRVETVKRDRLIRLYAEMKLPGRGWLQFEALPKTGDESRTILTQTVFFEPKGLMGHLYWYALYPFHVLIFSHMCKRIKRFSELSWGRKL